MKRRTALHPRKPRKAAPPPIALLAQTVADRLSQHLKIAPFRVEWVAEGGTNRAYVRRDDTKTLYLVEKHNSKVLPAVDSVIHEAFHQLVNRGLVSVGDFDNEALAQRFASEGVSAYMTAQQHGALHHWPTYFEGTSAIFHSLRRVRAFGAVR